MKKLFLPLFLILLFSLNSFAGPVSVQTASQIGQSFLSKSVTATGMLKTTGQQMSLKLIYTADTLKPGFGNQTIQANTQAIVPFYVFSAENRGYVIVAGDDRVVPILGYADDEIFDPDNIPPNMQKWLEGYKAEIRYAIENNIVASSEIQADWQALQSGISLKTQSLAASVAPLISTKWNQSPYYNDLCPYDYSEGERAVTGCVATAMAQVMKYWNYPVKGAGFHSYNHSNFGTLSANFGGTTYDWANMPNQLNSGSSPAQKNAVATLMYHCGVSLEMNYSVDGSSAMTICSGYTNCTASAEDALKTYFGYKNTLQGLHKKDYTNASWINLLKTELDAGRPMVYAGRGSEGGHAFICDGYDNSNYFHFNWGWNGSNDGYYVLTALAPGSGGVGGGTYEFTDSQRAIIGIEPVNSGSTSQNFDLQLYSGLSMSESKIWFRDEFSLTVDVVNRGTGAFSGDFGAAVFNSDGDYLDFIEILTGKSLSANYHYTNGLTFRNSGSAAFVPGIYYAALFYKTETQDWTVVSDGNYNNLVQFEIYYSDDIETRSAFTVTSNAGKLIQGKSATVNVDVKNAGSSTFYGKLRVNLATLDGTWAQNIQILNENDGLMPAYHYVSGLDFTGTITVEPGTYLMEVAYQSSGSSSWYYAGSSSYSNPVYVIVEASAIQADIYENNNTQSLAYNLPVSYSGNSAVVSTSGSNLHLGTDIDYYKITLPSGYKYAITPRLHDEYNSGNGQTYTVDALYSWSINGTTYSETYDDIMTDNITVSNGGTLYFKVAPYYSGSRGTYLLNLNVTRTPNTGIEDVETNARVLLFPNPAKDFVTIEIPGGPAKIHQIVLCDVQGRQIYTKNVADFVTKIDLPLTEVLSGVYFVQVHSDKGIITEKIVVEK